MDRFLALVLICTSIITVFAPMVNKQSDNTVADLESIQNVDYAGSYSINENSPEIDAPEFAYLNDPELFAYVEDSVYTATIQALDSDAYFVEGVTVEYMPKISKEYLEECEYNSRENIYFGYRLSELDAYFEGVPYVFTTNDEGETIVTAFEAYDDRYDRALTNVAIGTGAILITVTVSVVSGGLGAPAMSMIFAVSAKTGTIAALSSGFIGGVAAGIVTGIHTGDWDEAAKAAALTGSESFKWGAISGILTGAATEAIVLKSATAGGLTMNEAAIIQQETGYPVEIIRQFHSVDEYIVYRNAGLKPVAINGKLALIQDIDLDLESELGGIRVTNLERMSKGYAPIDADGMPYELHHIGQKSDGTLAVLTSNQHRSNASVLNIVGKTSEIDRGAFNNIRGEFWKSYAELLLK